MTGPRPRRVLPTPVVSVLRPAFRYSPHRDAYVLRLIGNSHGPVLVTAPRHEKAHAAS